jgi:hypothetical protein
MRILEWIAIGAVAVVIALAVLYLRRTMLARQVGTVELYLRLSTVFAGRGWAPGLARYTGDRLRWHRIFSFSPRPRRILTRTGMVVESRRAPVGSERLALPPDWVILRCTSYHAPVEIALAPASVPGFLTWLEAAPPGAASMRSMPLYPPQSDR